MESLEADKDISNEQLTTMKAKLDQYKEPNEDDVISNLKSMESDSENEGTLKMLPIVKAKQWAAACLQPENKT